MKKQNAFVNVADEQVSFYFILATLQNVLEQGGSLISLPPRRSTKGHELNFVCASHLFFSKTTINYHQNSRGPLVMPTFTSPKTKTIDRIQSIRFT